MSFRRFIALLCLIAGSFGSGTVAALDCTITIGRSCQGVDNVFNIDSRFPLDFMNYWVITNRGAAECTLAGNDSWRESMNIPGGGAINFYGLGQDKLIVSEGRKCDLSIRVEPMSHTSRTSPSPPLTFDVVCPPVGSYGDGQTVGDGWKIRVKSTGAETVWRWYRLTSRPGHEPETTELSCQSLGQNTVFATKVIPGNFSCSGKSDDRNFGPLKGTCQPQ